MKLDNEQHVGAPSINPGRGVARPERRVPEEEKGGSKETVEYLIDKTTGEIKWVNEPTFDNQMKKFPGTFKFGAIQYEVFKLSAEGEGKVELNKFMAGTDPAEAPRILLLNTDKQFSEKEGCWLIMLTYQKVFYKVIIKESK
jgi:hypothetical protein